MGFTDALLLSEKGHDKVWRLADACEALHMSMNGSGEPLDDDEESELVAFLRARLGNWHQSYRLETERYDRAYRDLVEATLAEHDFNKSKPDWSKGCEVCGAKPVMPVTGMCGPCTTGEAETAGGNW